MEGVDAKKDSSTHRRKVLRILVLIPFSFINLDWYFHKYAVITYFLARYHGDVIDALLSFVFINSAINFPVLVEV